MAELFANILATPASDADDNGVVATLAEVLDNSETGVDVSVAAPSALRGGQFRIRIDNELMLVTSGQDTTTWTVTRGAEGTTAATHANGAKIRHVLTAASLVAAPSGSDETVNTVAATGASETIPLPTVATLNHLTLDANCTLTFPAAAAGRSFSLVLKQDATGSRTVTWPSIRWADGDTPPTLTTTAGKEDWFTFASADGSTWAGFVVGQNV